MTFSSTPIKSFILTIAFAISLQAFAADNRPNIILAMGDDHGWDEVAYYNHPYLKTPILDQMAAQGLRLDNFYSAHPTCSPTRGSVLTGRHPNRYGTFTPNWSMRPDEITIAHVLQKAGYATAHFGKWHVGPVKKDSPLNPSAMGFDEYLSHDNFFEMDPFLSRNGADPQKFPGESSEVVVEQTIAFIDQAKQNNQPFFIILWFGSPHEPYSGLPKDLALYDNLPKIYNDRTTKLTSNETGSPTTRPLGDVLRERYAEITAMDRSLGTLRKHLKDSSLRDNTLLWYCGDNGTPPDGIVTSPFRGNKGNMYEGGIRVPGMIEWPGRITTPRATNVNAVTSDMLPTICDLLNLPLPNRPLDGISLKPLIDNQMRVRPKPIFFWAYNTTREGKGDNAKPYIDPKLQEGTTPLAKIRAGLFTRNFTNFHHPKIVEQDFLGAKVILSNQYKLVIHESAKGTTTELFDLSADLAEQNDISNQEPKLTKNLQSQLRNWQQSVLNSLTGADYR